MISNQNQAQMHPSQTKYIFPGKSNIWAAICKSKSNQLFSCLSLKNYKIWWEKCFGWFERQQSQNNPKMPTDSW